MKSGLQTNVDEIAPDIFRISTWVPDISEHGFTFNQFLLTGEEPFLFHCGQRGLFPLVSAAIDRVIRLDRLRWISFSHVEADECGTVNHLLSAAPHAEVIHGLLACTLSLNDMCDRAPVVASPEPGDAHEIGGHRLRFIATPHVPHNWESGLWFDETISTLLAGDLLTHTGQCPALIESIVWHQHWKLRRYSMPLARPLI
jgi:flavorubredoxin